MNSLAHQTVISGEKQAVEAAVENLKLLKARAIPLKVSAPFHCSLMQNAADKLAKDLEKIEFKKADFPVISNVKAEIIKNPSEINELLARQVTASVRWLETIQNLNSLGVNKYYEFGSGKVLTGLVKRILKDAQAFSITDMANLMEVV